MATDVALGCLLEAEDKSLLLKTPHTYDPVLEGIKLDLTRRLPPSGLAFLVLQSALQAISGGKPPELIFILNP